MASNPVLDLDRLLAPISDDQPTGVALRDDATNSMLFFQVKDARQAARLAERKRLQRSMMTSEEKELDPDGEPQVDWQKVEEIAVTVIADHSKDLWVAAWLIEALARRYGFAGLRDGFQLVRELCDRYWGQLHPLPDEDGIATTMAQLAGLNGEDADGALIRPIEDIPLTLEPPLSSIHYENAAGLDTESSVDRRNELMAAGTVSLDDFGRVVNATGIEHFRELLGDIAAARQEFDHLAATLDEQCGTSDEGFALAPPTSNIRSTLEAVEHRVKNFTKHLLPSQDNSEVHVTADDQAKHMRSPAPTDGAVRNREEAFGVLLRLADFFQSTEPHSPVSYALQQAVRWGRMSLPELMQDILSDDDARKELFRRTGIPIPKDDDSG